MNCRAILIALCAWSGALFSEVENSIISTLERFEFFENLPLSKYTHNQYFDILQVLNRKEAKIRIVSYHIFNEKEDLQAIVELVNHMNPDIFSLQGMEIFHELASQFNSAYQCYVESENPHKNSNPIFVRRSRFSIISQETHALSERKQMTFLQLLDKETEQPFAVCNTRLSYEGPDQREKEVLSINERITLALNQMPVVLTGAFQAFGGRLDHDLIPFHDGDYLLQRVLSRSLKDARRCALLGHLGPVAAVSAYENISGVFPDRIFVTEGIQVIFHAIEPGSVNGRLPSAHMPIIVDFLVR